MLRPRAFLAALLFLLAALTAGCGSKTGLLAPDIDADQVDDVPFDAVDATDVTDVMEADVRMRPPRCFDERIHGRVGFQATLQIDTEGVVIASDGVDWTVVRTPPMGERDQVFPQGGDLAAFTPSKPGEYEIEVTIQTTGLDAGPLRCTILYIADPIDPMCPNYVIAEPRPVTIPNGDMQVAFDAVWDTARVTAGAGAGAVVTDEPAGRVSLAVVSRAVMGSVSDPMAALTREGELTENAVQSALGATPVLVGRSSTTHEGFPLRRSTLRVDSPSAVTPDVLRDRTVMAAVGIPAPAPDPFLAHLPAAAFYVEVATILRPDTQRTVHVIAVSPVAAFDDVTMPTAIRVNDMANATALARVGATLEVRCHQVIATRELMADFLWLVDTSGSMNDDQERVGRTAERFFAELNNAGVDFRVGVFQAGSRTPVLTGGSGNPGPFAWVSGTRRDGAREMAFQVTEQAFLGNTMDNRRPYRVDGQDEEPVAAGVLAVREFERRAAAGETNPEFVMRPNAAKVVFFVTDESGENDWTRFFRSDRTVMGTSWGSSPEMAIPVIADFFRTRGVSTFGLVPDFGGACPNVRNLPRCVIAASGGAFVPININEADADRQIASAMSRIVDAVAGAASEFILPTTPISGSLRTQIDRRVVPRSRADGFDYEERSRALIFRGSSFRPMRGQDVRTAYFIWR